MSALRARVEKGRLVLDEPTTLPDGTVVDLVVDDEGDDLTEEERRALHEALSASWKSAEAGRLRPASAILDELRTRRKSVLAAIEPRRTSEDQRVAGTIVRLRGYTTTESVRRSVFRRKERAKPFPKSHRVLARRIAQHLEH